MKTLEWNQTNCELILLDQRILPDQIEFVTCSDHLAVAEAIKNMTVRGAPAIGAVAAYGIAIAACRSRATNLNKFCAEMRKAAAELNASRPTAVNLAWAVQRMLKIVDHPSGSIEELRHNIIRAADEIADEDVKTNLRMAEFGEPLIDDGDTIIHHCNTGALATVDWGTALGVIRLAHEKGKRIHVLVDETRPRLQGARLTAWELQQYGIPFEIISDNAAGFFLHSGKVQKVFYGADRVAGNGDVANKIGSYMLALAAHDNDVPVYSVFPSSTVDLSLETGDQIPIEERDPDEVLGISMHGQRVMPRGAKARNPAFDVTPHRLITALITEKGVIYPPFKINLHRRMQIKES
jgi:methylthioribose-1-phosphate isomerase